MCLFFFFCVLVGMGFVTVVGNVGVRCHRKSVLCLASEVRESWPVARALKNIVFFSPLGGLLMPVEDRKMMEGTRKEEKVVVVTGATGGTGKRVVKEFVQRGGYRVRVVVRSEERARELFGKEISKRVEFFQSDLYNLHADFFRDASAVISCTGTKIGPTDDSPDREKYYQGVVFYPPVILEDTPENVEYVGVKRLSEKVAESMPKGEKVMDFADSVSIKNMWGVVDDIVMGGVSESSMQVSKDQKGLFQGYVSTANRGGFASVRTRPFEKPLPIDTSATRIILRVKGDGQRYKLNLRTDDKYDGIAFCYSFDTVKVSLTICRTQSVRI